ncbi:MAG: 7,8-didemethyl-8-hydroxy-5-deazariboflavin synthase subunit CofG [Cyanobacteria bacterium J06634_6]
MENVITYSPAYTLVPTFECFNRCAYCNFRVDPGQNDWMSIATATEKLSALQDQNTNHDVIELLMLAGEVHPHSPKRAAWFQRIYDLCELALQMGFLPHTNVGPLSPEEMAQMKQVNVSMGLMLEQLTPKLLSTVHANAPSKHPKVRVQQLELAGKLQIPFTTGLLLGVGESQDDWRDSLTEIDRIHAQYHHIQEVILQPYQPGQTQAEIIPACQGETLLQAVKIAREILSADITIQIPPNLVRSQGALIACIDSGARDLGGIGPIDEVNPDYHHRDRTYLQQLLQAHGWTLQKRLPIYPKYDSWLSEKLTSAVEKWRTHVRT